MNRLISILGNLKITMVLLVMILVVLSVGTILESLHGADRARQVYDSTAFRALLVVFVVNLVASLINRWPWQKRRIGFAITHIAMITILAGSLVTERVRVDGRLALWEGQQADRIASQGVDGSIEETRLPFAVRLDDFEIDVYPGTHRPAMFRSRVTVIDDRQGLELPAVIEMNHEFAHAGFKLYQFSYQVVDGREMSTLLVSRDPGQAIVFVGYILLILGMIVVLSTRIGQRRRSGFQPPAAGAASSPALAVIPTILGLLMAFGTASELSAATVPPAEVADELRALPVQHDGRVMPLDTVAREGVWRVTGRHKWGRVDQVAMVLGWSFSPQEWAAAPIVKLGDAALAEAIGLWRRTRHASFNDLVGNSKLIGLVERARARSQREEPLTAVENEALELEQRLVALQGFLMRQTIRPLPVSEDPVAQWSVPPEMNHASDLVELKNRLAAAPPTGYPNPSRMAWEVNYNRLRPTRLSWLVLIPTAVAALASWRRPNRLLDRAVAVGMVLGAAVMTLGIAMRWQAAGRIPASDMYESLLFLAWGVGFFGAIAAFLVRDRLVVFNAAALAGVVILLTDVLPMDPFIHPMPPVLSGTAWLAIHVPIIMVSYALLGLAAVVAHMRVGLEILSPQRESVARTMDEIHYWYVHIGSILLIAGIITGSIWAASSWGRYWGWDPKEVWSLIAFLAYMAILHGRIDRWLGSFGVAAASIIAFGTILMTYLGVNYVLAVGLHSYGFGGSRVAKWLLAVAVIELVFVTAGYLAYRRNRSVVGETSVQLAEGAQP